VPRSPGTAPETGPVRLPFPLSSPLALTNRRQLAPAKLLPWREVTRVSRRAVGVDDWSSNRVERTEERATAPWKRDFTATLDSSPPHPGSAISPGIARSQR
jgi:hypothetical protein